MSGFSPVSTAAVNEFSGFGLSPYFSDTNQHDSHPGAFVGSSSAATANRLYVHPYVPRFSRALTAIACYCGSGQTGNVRMGIYNATQADGIAILTLLAETSSNTVVAGKNSFSITASVTGGKLYWLAGVFDGAPSFRTWTSGMTGFLGADFQNGMNISPGGYYRAHTFGALPDLTGQTMTQIGSVVAFGVR